MEGYNYEKSKRHSCFLACVCAELFCDSTECSRSQEEGEAE